MELNSKFSLKEQIYSAVFEQIIRGEYRDTNILNEKMLIEKFNVSKSPVREALIALCNEGVLRSIPRYGYEIVRVSEREINKIRDYRVVLECGFLDKYWDMITEEKLTMLEEFQQFYRQSIECNALEHWKRNTIFHLKLASCYENEFMERDLKSSLLVLSRAYAQFHWEHFQRTVFISRASNHDHLLNCIRNGDKQKALKHLENDISTFEGDNYK